MSGHIRKGVFRAAGAAETPEGVTRQVGSDTQRGQREMGGGGLKVAWSFHVWFVPFGFVLMIL